MLVSLNFRVAPHDFEFGGDFTLLFILCLLCTKLSVPSKLGHFRHNNIVLIDLNKMTTFRSAHGLDLVMFCSI